MEPAMDPAPERSHLLWLSAVTWNFPLVGRTRMLTEAWARQGRETTFVQVPYLRTGVERLIQTVRARDPQVVYPWPALPVSWWQRMPEGRLRSVMRSRAAELRRQLEQRLDLSRTIALVVSPVWNGWLDDLPFQAVVYDCIDHVDVHAPRPGLRPLFRRWEDELIQRASAVVVSAQSLADSVRARRTDVPLAVVRNGVDSAGFRERGLLANRPADLPPVSGRPLVGFVGALYEWLDVPLVEAVARALPDHDFVFVGPADGRTTLPDLPNIHQLGLRPYTDVPAYVEAFDVCWLPFLEGQIADTANPVKLYEYLAMGKPVVSTPVADIDSFEGHVAVGRNVDGVVARLQTALAAPPGAADDRKTFADRNSWEMRARAFASFVDPLGAAHAAGGHPAINA